MKLTKAQWLGLVEANQEQIVDELEKMYADAVGGTRGIVYALEVDDEGKLHQCEFIGNSSFSGEVFEGTAIELARIETFSAWEGDEFDYSPSDDCILTDEEKKGFATYCKEYGLKRFRPWHLEDWDPNVYRRWAAEYEQAYIAEYARGWAENALERKINYLRIEAAWEAEQY